MHVFPRIHTRALTLSVSEVLFLLLFLSVQLGWNLKPVALETYTRTRTHTHIRMYACTRTRTHKSHTLTLHSHAHTPREAVSLMRHFLVLLMQLGWKELFQFALETSLGLDCLHSHEPLIVHRDLKVNELEELCVFAGV